MVPFSFQTTTQTHTLTHENTPLLTVTTHLPQAIAHHPMARRFNRYYHTQHRAYLHYASDALLPLAITAWTETNCQPIIPFTATLSYEPTYQSHTLLSLYTQAKDNLPPTPTLHRRGDTWDLSSGFLLPITQFLPRTSHSPNLLATAAWEQIQTMQTQGFAQFYPQVNKLFLKRHYNPHHYYLTPDGLCFFYPMYAIAPAIEQIPTFFYPLSLPIHI